MEDALENLVFVTQVGQENIALQNSVMPVAVTMGNVKTALVYVYLDGTDDIVL